MLDQPLSDALARLTDGIASELRLAPALLRCPVERRIAVGAGAPEPRLSGDGPAQRRAIQLVALLAGDEGFPKIAPFSPA